LIEQDSVIAASESNADSQDLSFFTSPARPVKYLYIHFLITAGLSLLTPAMLPLLEPNPEPSQAQPAH
jgi:hypothetical protein